MDRRQEVAALVVVLVGVGPALVHGKSLRPVPQDAQTTSSSLQ